MNTEITRLSCPYCGGEFQKSPNQGGFERHRCKNCGYELYIENEHSREKLYALNAFRNEVINLLHAKIDGGKEERIANWKSNEKKLEQYIEQCGGESNQDPLFAIARAAYITDGFERYFPKEEKTTVEALYSISKKYADENDKAVNIKELNALYRKKLRNKGRNAALAVLGTIGGILVAGVAALSVMAYQYAPVPFDEKTGIVISVPNDAVSIFDKFNVDILAELQPHNSKAYIDAKNALHNETEKFELYDIALQNGDRALNFDGEVTVEIPIPEGYKHSALKIYHIISDEEIEEIPSTVSSEKGTISFKTTHFSFFAVAERHPIVSFDTNGANEIDRQIVERDSLAQKPEDPIKEGFTFGGWKNGNEVWNFDAHTVKKDITLTAQWIPNKYTVTLVAGIGTVSTDSIEVSFMGTYSALPDASKDGYTFIGWFTDETNGVCVAKETTMQTAKDHTLYARFEKNENRIVFNANGGVGNMRDLMLETGESAKLPQNAFTKVGYTFIGWSTSITGDAVFSDKQEYTMGTKPEYTLYAVWKINTGTLKLEANGGEGNMDPIVMDYGETQRLPEILYHRSGYTFIGWSTSPNGQVVFGDRAEYMMGEKNEYVLYAQWKIKTNKIHFESNGGSGTMNYIEADYDTFVTLPANAFYRNGYIFAGWSTAPNGEKLYSDEGEYKMGPDSDYTLYALWVGEQNSVIFDANGGEGHMPSDFTIATGESKNLPDNKFTRGGYRFLGWGTDAHGRVKYEDGAEYSMQTGQTVYLYAIWEIIDYTIEFDSKGGSSVESINYNAETDTFELPVPVKNGYEFGGWYTNEDYTGDGITVMYRGSSENRKLYAKWNVINYDITYESNGGTYIDGRTYNIETPEFALPIPQKNGYTFEGWYKNRYFEGDAVVSVSSSDYGDFEFYAKWSLNTYTITFESNGGRDIDSITYNCETNGFYLPTPTRTGYTFGGWFDNEDFTGYATDYIYNGECDDKIFYAKWQAVEYTISFNSNGGDYVENRVYNIGSETFSLPVPKKNGYTFVGWYTNENFDGDAVASVVIGSTGDMKLYAKWSMDTYTIVFHPNNEEEMDNISYTYETESFRLPVPTRNGYTFDGWYGDSGFLTERKPDYVYKHSSGNMELYAKWKAIEYTIIFNSNYGTSIENKVYTVDTETFDLPIPQKVGYTFAGWYEASNFSGDPVMKIEKGSTETKRFYAKWTPITYTVTFNTNGGEEIAPINYQIISNVVRLTVPTKNGYTFAGWYYDEDLTDAVENNMIPSGSSGDKSLYASWTPTPYTVTYKMNGAAEIENGSFTIESDTFNLPTPERTGYTFGGWYDNATFSGEAVTKVDKGSVGNKTFYAKWTAITYNVTFVTNGGEDVDPMTYTIDMVWSLDLPRNPKRDGYTFAGWYTDSECTSAQVTSIPVRSYGDKIFYAKWTPVTYTITYYVNGGSAIENKTFDIEDDTFELPIPTRTAYTFAGWYDNSNCEGTPIAEITKGSFDNKKLYAKWTPIEYTISFVTNGAAAIEQIKYNITTPTFTLPTPTKDGYKFVGWYYDGEFNEEVSYNKIGGTYGDKTVYAKWQTVTYDIYFYPKNGESTGHLTYNVESGTVDLPTPTMVGHTFMGWYDNEQYEGEPVDSVPTGSFGIKKFYAKWSDWHKYTVVYDANGGDGIMSNSQFVYNVSSKLATNGYVRDYYVFAGWALEKDGDAIYRNEAYVSGLGSKYVNNETVTLYAKWTPIEYKLTFHYNYDNKVSSTNYNVETDIENLIVPEREGYMFVGWFESEDLSGNAVTTLAKGSHGNKDLYAKWSNPASYTVEYDPNGGTGTTAPSSHVYGVFSALTANGFTRSGCEFIGWSETPDGEVKYTDQKSVKNLTTENGAVITLYAQWKELVYSLKHVYNDGDREKTVEFSILDGVSNYIPFTIEYSAYPQYNLFEGWFVDEELTIPFDPAILVTEPGKYTTVYAKWGEIYTNVYTNIANTPDINVERAIINWSDAVNADVLAVRGNGVLTISNKVKKLVIIGNENQVYTNFSILLSGFAKDQEITISFVNFNFITNANAAINPGEADNGVILTIDVNGKCSIKTSVVSGSIVTGFTNEVIFTGDGTMEISAGVGESGSNNGGDGGIGIEATNVTVFMSGSLNVFGGDGGYAENRSSGDNGGDGSNGRAGYHGGVGGVAIKAETVTVDSGTLNAKGGDGGEGGNGSECNYAWSKEVTGGTGGNGGNGAVAISAMFFVVSENDETLSINITGGSGGQTGRPGGCHENDHGGGWADKGWAKDGSVGVAGVGASAFSSECVITDSLNITVSQNGSDGVVDTELNQS